MRVSTQPQQAAPAAPRKKHNEVLLAAYEGFCELRNQGEAVSPEDYCERFPDFRSSLRTLLRAHLLMDENTEKLEGEPTDNWPEAGDPFLDFELHSELGRGSFSRVFLATQPALGSRWVAVKVCNKPMREAQILGPLDHDNIVPINSLQIDAICSLTAMCMPYLGSATLERLLDRVGRGLPARATVILEAAEDTAAPLEVKEQLLATAEPAEELKRGTYIEGVCYLGSQIADALAFIHKRGICHRDLKPSNVLLRPNGKPMLLDFNLSGQGDRGNVRMGGTLPYMAPEQLQAWYLAETAKPRPKGERKLEETTVVTNPGDSATNAVDSRSDVFSLGVILYELLSGKHPFGPVPVNLKKAQLFEFICQRQRLGHRPLRQLSPAVDTQLADIVERCLCYDAAQRPTADEVARVLRGRLALGWRKWLVRHPWILVSVCLLFLATAAAGAIVVNNPATPRRFHLKEALAAAKNGELTKASAMIDQVLLDAPDNLEAQFIRGRIRQHQAESHGDFNFAFSDYSDIDRKVKTDGRIKALLGYCAYQMKIPHATAGPTTKPFFQQALELGYETAQLRSDFGELCIKLGKLDEARKHLDRALQLKEGFVIALYNRARLSLNQGLKQANYFFIGIEDATRALALEEHADLYYVRGQLRALASRTHPEQKELAMQDLREAVKLGRPLPAPQDTIFRDLPGYGDPKPATNGGYRPMRRVIDPLDAKDAPV